MNKKIARSGTFTDNMKLPIHRWFRYSAGFSAEWVQSEIQKYEEATGLKARILDPFVGSGTTVLAACATGNEAYGFDGHPFVARIAKAKNLWHLDESEFKEACQKVFENAKSNQDMTQRHDETNLLGKCYDFEALTKLDRLRFSYEKLADDNPIWELVRLNITSILRACSNVGTAQWQYVLPNKTKSKVLDAFEAFLGKADLMASDMEYAKSANWKNLAHIYEQDVREAIDVPKCNLLITSPPYPNNYDYADATRLEMMFWGEIDGWSDLKTAVRPTIMRSCSQHSAADKIVLDEILQEPLLAPIINELTAATKELEKVRLTKGGKKTYHTMIAAYFFDLAKIWKNTRSVMDENSKICFVIGDSAPYGVHIPAEKWLGELALASGYQSFEFEKLRDRNVKWKNRTHTVPLHEGRLWIKG
ncbi:site-specific DNA-methyltransferase [Sulfurovum mangrovi]|uniref:site-specific DNA-methyltransferase n=1 Tax=Sulfurovum mangrovi TaxID=2893889 RepID=UPI001E393F93|nr:site-specific DNA-methyltransferase [Sulfurovum mangrovi]UFH60335.1 site-specific DNA-methyltransferase [Sulfurovum mangrovi]